jgi:hypothetical protein
MASGSGSDERVPLLGERGRPTGAVAATAAETAHSRDPVGRAQSDRERVCVASRGRRAHRLDELCFWLIYAVLLVASIVWALISAKMRGHQRLQGEPVVPEPAVANTESTSFCQVGSTGWNKHRTRLGWSCTSELRSRATLGRAVSQSAPLSILEKVKSTCPNWRRLLQYPALCRRQKRSVSGCGSFLWISDLHVDYWFDPRVPPTLCGERKVCRPAELVYNVSSQVSDASIPNNPAVPVRDVATTYTYGRPGCDPPLPLLESLTEAMKKVDSDPDFILITGDLAPHDLPSRAYVLRSLNASAQHLSATVCGALGNSGESQRRSPRCIVVVGNVDLFPTLHIPIEAKPVSSAERYDAENNNQPVRFRDLYELYVTAGILDPENEALRRSFTVGGYYRAYDDGKLRVLVYNSLHYIAGRLFSSASALNRTNASPALPFYALPCEQWKQVLPDADDPAGQFAWLEEELQDAEQNGRSVFLASHIGPGSKTGSRAWCAPYVTRFADLLTKYADTVTMQFYGDLSREELRLIEPYGSPNGTSEMRGLALLINPGLTPRRMPGGAPTFRHCFFDRGIHRAKQVAQRRRGDHVFAPVTLLDYHAYAFPLQHTVIERMTRGASAPHPEWRWRYSFAEQFCVPHLSASTLRQVIQNIASEPEFMEAYTLRTEDGLESDLDLSAAVGSLRVQPAA